IGRRVVSDLARRTRAAARVRLLLDAMYNPVIADQLRRRGHDAVSAHEIDTLGSAPDETIVAFAIAERCVVVTENIHDFLRIDRELRAQGREHFGMLLTTNQSFSRHQAGGVGRLVTALDAWLREHPEEATESSLIWWL